MKFSYVLIVWLVLFAQYSFGYYRGSKEAVTEAKSAVEGWTSCLEVLNHCQKTAKEAIELCRK